MLRWIEIQAHHVRQLFGECLVVGEFERSVQMRLEAMGLPDPPDGALADARGASHRAGAPVGGVLRLLLERVANNGFHLVLGEGLPTARPGSVLFESIDTQADEPLAPSSTTLAGDVQFTSDHDILEPARRQQHNLRPLKKRTETERLLVARISCFFTSEVSSTAGAILMPKSLLSKDDPVNNMFYYLKMEINRVMFMFAVQ